MRYNIAGVKVMKKITGTNLIKRWENDTVWKCRWEHIVSWLFGKNEENNWLNELEYTSDGYWDLRGFSINFDVDFKKYTDRKKEDLMKDSRNLISNKEFEKIDFSFADFTGRCIKNCKFYNCIFNNTIMCDITESQSEFVDCVFKRGIYGGTLGLGGGKYKNVQFQSVKMHRTQMFWPDFEDCLFQNCNLNGTDFGGSHFKNVKFVGDIKNVWFRGKLEASKSGRYWESKYERWNRILPMEVDFSEASLRYIAVSDFCDLSKVILPKDGSCYLIPDMERMRGDIRKRQSEKNTKLLDIFLKFHLRKMEGEKMGILCLNDVYKQIEKYIDQEDWQKNFYMCREICEDLTKQGILEP